MWVMPFCKNGKQPKEKGGPKPAHLHERGPIDENALSI